MSKQFSNVTVYVAGAFNAPSAPEMLNNMRKGMRTCKTLMELGIAPFCPWLDYHYALIGDGFENELTLQHFYDYSITWLRRCDYMLLVPGWEKSKGTHAEILVANKEMIEVFEDIDDLLMKIRADNRAFREMEETFENYHFIGASELGIGGKNEV